MGAPQAKTKRAIDRLCRVGGPDLANKVIELFLNTTPERIAAMQDGEGRDDLELVEHVAHSLRSSAGNVGLETIQELAGQIEALARARKRQTISRLLQQIEAAYEEASRELVTARKGLEK